MKEGFNLPSGGAKGLLYTKTSYLFWFPALLVNMNREIESRKRSLTVNSTPL